MIKKLPESYIRRSAECGLESGLNLLLASKINELIDSFSDQERNRSEQMARVMDRLIKLEDKPEEPELLGCPFCGVSPKIESEEIRVTCENGECLFHIVIHLILGVKQSTHGTQEHEA